MVGCTASQPQDYASDILNIAEIADGTYVHTSYLETADWGRVGCNGLVYINNGFAVVYDAPTHQAEAEELIHWIKTEHKAEIKAVIATHFHIDCVGGLKAFHEQNIPSFANHLTLELVEEQYESPETGFSPKQVLNIGGTNVINQYLGAAHTNDNIFGYIPEVRIVFGGCALKAMNAPKGNLNDANVEEWPNTMERLKATFPDATLFVPGHGQPGGIELVDYTIQLFKEPTP